MANLTERHGSYYVRFIVPKERWRDVGAVLGSSTGLRRDVLKSLQTKDRKTAFKLRDAALEAIRRSLNLKLAEAGLPPLHGDVVPDWMSEECLLSEALEARREIAATSDRTDGGDEQMGETDPRRRLIEGMDYFLEERAEQLEKAGKNPSDYVRRLRWARPRPSAPFLSAGYGMLKIRSDSRRPEGTGWPFGSSGSFWLLRMETRAQTKTRKP
ncbi:hypothetical protein [Gluconobacter morbifer]|nr:hypothetical protein [Gluconobacter morbifer]